MHIVRQLAFAAAGLAAAIAGPLAAQIETVDPDKTYQAPIDGDLELPAQQQPPAESPPADPVTTPSGDLATEQPYWSEQSLSLIHI